MSRVCLIISAGNQSRFSSDVPKALSKIGEKTLLDLNIESVKDFVDDVIVVTSFENDSWFSNYKTLPIKSGLGCGDAVLKALELITYDEVIIMWGDSFHKKSIFTEFNDFSKITVPVVFEDNPYVQIMTNDDTISGVMFSKYKDSITPGYHDLSVFYGDANYIKYYLRKFADKISVNEKYVHKHNNELTFLDVFNDTDIKGKIQVMDEDDYSFNTLDELESISLRLNKNIIK